MPNDLLSLRRRNVYERKTVRILRGEAVSAEPRRVVRRSWHRDMGGVRISQDPVADFRFLRSLAEGRGMTIMPLHSSALSADEVTILCWLAWAQRRCGSRGCGVRDLVLQTTLQQCADNLKRLNVFLPSQTLYLSPEQYVRVAATDALATGKWIDGGRSRQ